MICPSIVACASGCRVCVVVPSFTMTEEPACEIVTAWPFDPVMMAVNWAAFATAIVLEPITRPPLAALTAWPLTVATKPPTVKVFVPTTMTPLLKDAANADY